MERHKKKDPAMVSDPRTQAPIPLAQSAADAPDPTLTDVTGSRTGETQDMRGKK